MVRVRKTPEGYVVPMLVTPGASRNRLCGEHNGTVKVSLTAPPEKGKANKALCSFISRELGINRSQVRIISGRTSRQKEVLLERVPYSALEGIIA